MTDGALDTVSSGYYTHDPADHGFTNPSSPSLVAFLALLITPGTQH
jgi:hypothetical protein